MVIMLAITTCPRALRIIPHPRWETGGPTVVVFCSNHRFELGKIVRVIGCGCRLRQLRNRQETAGALNRVYNRHPVRC